MAHSVKKRALFLLSAETPLPWPLLPPLLMWPRCGNVCWSSPLSLVWVSGVGGLQANCALPKGLQQTVETLAPSHRPLHCVNICASGFSKEETEAQISVLEGWSLEAHGNSLSKKNTSHCSSLPHPRQLLPQTGLLHQTWGRSGALPARLQGAAVS